VNYPAHLVIIKNTQTFINNRSDEVKESDLLQMIGRAGRPQFDDTGLAVILTRSDKRSKYENLISGNEALESRLHDQLSEHFNAEIGLGTIVNLDSAISWLKSTFFYVRCWTNPSYYGLNTETGSVDEWVGEKCSETIRSLQELGLIETSPSGKLQTTAYGQAAIKFYVRLNSMNKIMAMKEEADLRDVVFNSHGLPVNLQLDTLCKADEFSQYHLRAGEKVFYNTVVNQNSAIRFPFKADSKEGPAIQATWQKVSLLIQVRIVSLEI
jgi:ATP-dependent DNA helicase HFM1/MER3